MDVVYTYKPVREQEEVLGNQKKAIVVLLYYGKGKRDDCKNYIVIKNPVIPIKTDTKNFKCMKGFKKELKA